MSGLTVQQSRRSAGHVNAADARKAAAQITKYFVGGTIGAIMVLAGGVFAKDFAQEITAGPWGGPTHTYEVVRLRPDSEVCIKRVSLDGRPIGNADTNFASGYVPCPR